MATTRIISMHASHGKTIAGCEVRRRGNTLSLRHPGKKGFVRLSSIDGYTEDELCVFKGFQGRCL